MTAVTSNFLAPLAGAASDLIENVRRSVVLVRSSGGHGSGIIWQSGGLIVTNHHVAHRDRAEIETTDGQTFQGVVEARDSHNDLAALRVQASDLPAAPIGDSSSLRVGELIIAVGNPFGVRGTATLGIVSGSSNATWMGQARRELLQADVDLAPGNSGGPLVDASGRIVGIASMILSPGIALAIPSKTVQRFVEAMPGSRRVYLGVATRPVLLTAAKQSGANYAQGLLLVEIAKESPAESGGLLQSDVLLALDGQPIEEPDDLAMKVAYNQETPLKLTVLRGGTVVEREVKPKRSAA